MLAYEAPFRYRSYYFDSEINMYYLNSRYYDAKMYRFINADDFTVIGATPGALTDKNLFAYCDNNPVMRIDEDGEFWNFVVGGVVGAAVGAIVSAINGGDLADILIGAASGALSGIVAASSLGWLAQAGISAAISATADIANQTVDIVQNGGSISDYNVMQTVVEAGLGFVTSAIGSGLGALTGKYITKTSVIADQAFDSYLQKTFVAGMRMEAGRSSSALLRQGSKFLTKSIFYDNVTRGVSSAIGSIFSLWNIAR